MHPAAGTGSPQVSEAEARRVAEEAREAAWLRPSFGKQLFLNVQVSQAMSRWAVA